MNSQEKKYMIGKLIVEIFKVEGKVAIKRASKGRVRKISKDEECEQ